MDAETLILAVLDAVPSKEIQGKKRLQKMSYFALQKGAEASVRFFLHDFGPFSADIASATDLLAFLGDLEEREVQIGRSRIYSKLYRLTDPSSVPEHLPEETVAAIRALDEFTTIELEIASTIFYFMSSERLNFSAAIDATKRLKPSKSQPGIIKRAQDALSKVGLYERGRANSMPGA
jgi:uncharacterized protein YwgA